MGNSPSIPSTIGGFLLKWRWQISILLSGGILVLEVIEHHPVDITQIGRGWIDFRLNSLFLVQVIVLGISLPVCFGICLSLLHRFWRQQSLVAGNLGQIQEIGRIAGNPSRWDELLGLLICYPRSIAPMDSAGLWVYDPLTCQYDLGIERAFNHQGPSSVPSFPSCLNCRFTKAATILENIVTPCRCQSSIDPQYEGRDYCLFLSHQSVAVGFLRFCLPMDLPLTPQQIHTLNSAAPTLALALEATRPSNLLFRQAKAARMERRQIARDLHDTVAQDLALLSSKLDQISSLASGPDFPVTQHEVSQMQALAQDAYQHIRGSLEDLQSDRSINLAQTIQEQARQVADRANLAVHCTVDGEGERVAPYLQRQIAYIVREALANIEKHTYAAQVDISMVTQSDQITVKIADDGQGFLADAEPKRDGHYGLRMMAEIAEEMGGRLAIHSQPGSGTEILLTVPYSDPFLNT